MERLWVNGANLAHIMQESPQQITRWKADGLIRFNDDGIVSAAEAIRVFMDWKKRAGKMPIEAAVWNDLKADGIATADYCKGYLDGIDAVGVLVYRLVQRLDWKLARAMFKAEYPKELRERLGVADDDDDSDDAGGDDDNADGDEGGIPPMSEEVRALLATLQA